MISVWRLIRRSLAFHWRIHLGVVLGAAIGSAALIGALVVGDSVRESLLSRAEARLGRVELVLDSGDRLFGGDLADRIEPARFWNPPRTPQDDPRLARPQTFSWGQGMSGRAWTLHLRGTMARQDGSSRAHEVQIYGATPSFWALSPSENVRLLPAGPPQASPVGPGVRGGSRGPAGSTVAPSRPMDVGLARSGPEPGKVRINAALAEQLGAHAGDSIILRFAKPTALSPDAVLSPRNDASVALRAVVDTVVEAGDFGEFSLKSGSRPPLNAFVNLDELARLSGVTNRGNLLLIGPGTGVFPEESWRRSVAAFMSKHRRRLPDPVFRLVLGLLRPRRLSVRADTDVTEAHLRDQLSRHWRLSDAEIGLRILEPPQTETGGEWIPPMIEVATRRIFLDPPVGRAAMTPRTNLVSGHADFGNDSATDLAEASQVTRGLPLITYLANALQAGGNLTPYSMVTAAGPPWTPADLGDDEIVVNEWLAADLAVKPGDRLELVYFDPEAGARLIERTNAFTVRAIVPLRGVHADRTLMPEFPGLAKAESTSDWDAGFPLVHDIREKDEAYWKQHRGTPKAFVTLKAGRAMWANRFGEFTAIRFPVGPRGFASATRRAVEANLVANLKPAEVGLAFEPVRTQALKAATSGQDFGQLFLAFSFFLVVAALLLMALLFQFGLEQRLPEVGTLLALGFRPRTVRWIWLGEASVLAAVGGLLGVAGGLVYAGAVMQGLSTIWRDAVAGTALSFHATPASLGVGLFASVFVCALTIWLATRRQFKRPARALLGREGDLRRINTRSRGAWIGAGALAGALGLVSWALARGDTANPAVFFGAGSLFLIGGLALVAAALAWMQGVGGSGKDSFTSWRFALLGTARRGSRSLTTAGLLASGTFLIAAVGAFRLDAGREAWERDSGTGGFALIAEASLPVVQDLNTRAGLESFGLGTNDLPGVSFVPFRVRDGDDASCLNLDRAQRPRILGVNPQQLAGRGAFTFAMLEKGFASSNGWHALFPADGFRLAGAAGEASVSPAGGALGVDREIPAIGDAASIQWALGKKIGDTLDLTDERGRRFRLRLVGGVANSILQGSLVIDEAAFIRLFPGEVGYRWFLVDAPRDRVDAVSTTLSRALADVGVEVTPSIRRLSQYNAVQNTYLTTFQILGALGLLLGSAGLGVVVLRNVLERRGELALLTAVGFRRRTLERLVLGEHAALLLTGLGIGLFSAAMAVLPSLLGPTVELPVRSLGFTVGGVVLLGLLTTWAATRASLRGSLLAALRGE